MADKKRIMNIWDETDIAIEELHDVEDMVICLEHGKSVTVRTLRLAVEKLRQAHTMLSKLRPGSMTHSFTVKMAMDYLGVNRTTISEKLALGQLWGRRLQPAGRRDHWIIEPICLRDAKINGFKPEGFFDNPLSYDDQMADPERFPDFRQPVSF